MTDQQDELDPKPDPSGVEKDEGNRQSLVEMSVPWDREGMQMAYFASQRMIVSDQAKSGLIEFTKRRSEVHELYIREEAKTKRLYLMLAAFLIIASAFVVLFAPEGREPLSYWIGAALLVFAAGAAGYKRVWGKTKNISMGADQDRRPM